MQATSTASLGSPLAVSRDSSSSSLSGAAASSCEIPAPGALVFVSSELVIKIEPEDLEEVDQHFRDAAKGFENFKWPEVTEEKKNHIVKMKQKRKRTPKGKRGKEGEDGAEEDEKLISDDGESLFSKDITETVEKHKDHKENAVAQEDLSETLQLRKLRQRPQEIDSQKLSKGQKKRKKKWRKAMKDQWQLKNGRIVNMEDVRAAERFVSSQFSGGCYFGLNSQWRIFHVFDFIVLNDRENDTGAEKGMKLYTYAKQRNTFDVDMDMVAYIEAELKRQCGQFIDPKEEEEVNEEPRFEDIYDELYEVPELNIEAKPVAKGNVQWSTQMLSVIPEADLEIE
ncbi:hypothetical protein BC938DRAFT_474697 [Jimgerdemannia flammicorona]|uniref:Uncharacterized protein n=1 Tax=Jimgerdemannia flammicorona TaxID=994334 RepID=A0A433Q1T7_9FUNG|nr:hypothetical protein BC938DRAFT_474697 [Jimgerdemannia flammicorona]